MGANVSRVVNRCTEVRYPLLVLRTLVRNSRDGGTGGDQNHTKKREEEREEEKRKKKKKREIEDTLRLSSRQKCMLVCTQASRPTKSA